MASKEDYKFRKKCRRCGAKHCFGLKVTLMKCERMYEAISTSIFPFPAICFCLLFQRDASERKEEEQEERHDALKEQVESEEEKLKYPDPFNNRGESRQLLEERRKEEVKNCTAWSFFLFGPETAISEQTWKSNTHLSSCNIFLLFFFRNALRQWPKPFTAIQRENLPWTSILASSKFTKKRFGRLLCRDCRAYHCFTDQAPNYKTRVRHSFVNLRRWISKRVCVTFGNF